MTIWNVNIPPYNPMGRLAHEEPELAEIYRNAEDVAGWILPHHRAHDGHWNGLGLEST